MNIFKERQTVKKRKQWMKRLRQLERILLSLTIVLTGLASLYGIYHLVFFGDSFAIEKIVVEGDWHYLSAERLAKLTDIKRHENLFWISMDDIHDRLHSDPWVRAAAVRRRLPDTVWIYAEEYRPAAMVSDDGLFYVDRYGEIFKTPDGDDDRDFPVFTGIDIGTDGTLEGENKTRVMEMLGIVEVFRASNFGKKMDVAEINYDDVKGYSVITKREPMQILIGHAAFKEMISQIDRMISAVEKKPGRITYMIANEPERLIVRYQAS